MNAKWLVTTNDEGVNLTYHNLVDGIIMDCGTTKMSSNLQDFLDFAMAEGAMNGDGMYLDGVLVCEILLNEVIHDSARNYSN